MTSLPATRILSSSCNSSSCPHTMAVDKGPIGAGQVTKIVVAVLFHDLGMVPRSRHVVYEQVDALLTTDGEETRTQRHRLTVVLSAFD